jgi:hypothetical protein
MPMTLQKPILGCLETLDARTLPSLLSARNRSGCCCLLSLRNPTTILPTILHVVRDVCVILLVTIIVLAILRLRFGRHDLGLDLRRRLAASGQWCYLTGILRVVSLANEKARLLHMRPQTLNIEIPVSDCNQLSRLTNPGANKGPRNLGGLLKGMG